MAPRRERSSRVYIHTLGCPKNDADSRAIMRALGAAGIAVVEDPDKATHVLVNTCGFIQAAKEESIGAILDACAGYADKAVLVMGCLVERYRAELGAGIPEVAAWFGVAGGEVERALIDLLVGETTGPGDGEVDRNAPGRRARGEAWAYLKISDGCDEPCTFCAIPGIKGAYHSLPAARIVTEARACVDEGARELVLVGQDTTRWTDGAMDLLGLVDVLSEDERVARLRVMYLQPERVTDGLLRGMATRPKLCRYLDVPFQHSHPQIVRSMGRWGEGRAYLELLDRARRLMPDVTARTSLIVGFPGEREEHFEHLLDFAEQAEFDYAGGFVYSPEEGTPAEALRPRVRRAVALDRLNRLNETLATGAERRHQRLVGSVVEVMIDSLDPEDVGEGVVAVGRTNGQAPEVDGLTYVEGVLPFGTAVGDRVRVRVGAAVGYDLVGVCDAS